jgi:hypothetical protein
MNCINVSICPILNPIIVPDKIINQTLQIGINYPLINSIWHNNRCCSEDSSRLWLNGFISNNRAVGNEIIRSDICFDIKNKRNIKVIV